MRYARPTIASCAPEFTEALARLGNPARPLLAVSGGGDSLAMLLLAHTAEPGGFAVATFDHGLRPAGAVEAAFVATLCAERDILHAILTPKRPIDGQSPQDAPGSLQSRARSARYDALSAHALAQGCDAILTAHHRDDQAETLLMRAARGSGVDGLAGVRPVMRWEGMAVLRPLLDWPRSRLADVVEQAGIVPVDDPSNADPAYDRTRIRALLATTPALDPAALARSAAALADASDALKWSVERLAETRITWHGTTVLVDATGLPDEYRHRLLTTAFERLDGHIPRGSALNAVLKGLSDGRRLSLGDRLIAPRTDGTWAITPAPPRRSTDAES